MLDKKVNLKILLILTIALSACSYVLRDQGSQTKTVCPAIPESFTEDDLIGTWIADYANGNFDKIVIREDGKYKQIFSSTVAALNFVSDWKNWWIEYRDSGYIRLHLEAMQRCDDLESICQNPGGGIEPDLFRTIDYCEDIGITMEREVILIVTGTQYDVRNGIVLRHAKLSGSDWSYVFEYLPQDGVESGK